MRKTILIISLSLTICFCGASSAIAKEKFYIAAPTLIPHTTRAMKTAGFWISRHPNPDEIILSSREIQSLNAQIQSELKLTKNILRFAEEFSAKELKTSLENTLSDISKKGFYTKEGKKAGQAFFNLIKDNMNLDALSDGQKPQFGFIVRFADQRFLPTKEILTEGPLDINFDELQNSDLDAGEPVIVLHQSQNGKWFYVQSAASNGWVEAEQVALCDAADIKDFLLKDDFVVVTKAKADIYLNPELTRHYDYVRMGVRLPVVQKSQDTLEILLPSRNKYGLLIMQKGYLKESDVSDGYLSYTPRRIITQAFELLNAPYGWGGMHGEQDCSRFLQEIFATVGINLPRDSKDQAQVGKLMTEFNGQIKDEQKRDAIVKNAVGGVTLLPLKGHILLYLGVVNAQPYVIHASWAFTDKIDGKDTVRVLNRVVVSDLSLSENTKKTSLLKRILAVKNISSDASPAAIMRDWVGVPTPEGASELRK